MFFEWPQATEVHVLNVPDWYKVLSFEGTRVPVGLPGTLLTISLWMEVEEDVNLNSKSSKGDYQLFVSSNLEASEGKCFSQRCILHQNQKRIQSFVDYSLSDIAS